MDFRYINLSSSSTSCYIRTLHFQLPAAGNRKECGYPTLTAGVSIVTDNQNKAKLLGPEPLSKYRAQGI